jgi:hypothetical protein
LNRSQTFKAGGRDRFLVDSERRPEEERAHAEAALDEALRQHQLEA